MPLVFLTAILPYSWAWNDFVKDFVNGSLRGNRMKEAKRNNKTNVEYYFCP